MSSRFIMPFADVGSGIKPSSGAKLFFFDTDGVTPKDTYSDQLSTPTANTNPVISDSNGLFSDIYISGQYKVTLKDKNDSQIFGLALVDEIISNEGLANGFGTKALMVADTDTNIIESGNTIFTQGYTTAGDGGGATYLVKTTAQASTDGDVIDGYGNHALAVSGLVAILQFDTVVTDKKFGAVGNLVADDTSSIQAALDSKATEILITQPCKTVAVLDAPSNKTIRWLAGGSLTNTSGVDIFTHSDDTVNDNIRFLNPILNGTALSTTMYAFNIANVTNLEVYDGGLEECGNGIRIHTCVGAKIKRNKVANGRKGIVIEGASNFLEVEYNECHDNTIHGIQCLGGNDSSILNNICYNNGDTGIAVNGTTFLKMKINYNNCFSNGGGVGATLEQGINTHGVTDSEVIGNICTNNVKNGIDISGHSGSPLRAVYTIVKDNISKDNLLAGMKIFTSEKILVQGNMLHGNLQNLVVQGSGGGTDIELCNNFCFDTTDTTLRANVYINQADGVCYIHDNFIGERDSVAVNNFAIYLDAAITGTIILGYNNFDSCLNPKAVQMANTINSMELPNKDIYISDIIDLSGAAVNDPVAIPNTPKYSFIHKVRILYTEATSADAGITVGLGDGGASPTKWATGTTEVSKAIGNELLLTLNRRGRLDPNTVPYFYSAGGKTGAGSIRIVIEYDPLIPVNF
jgi:hypothetical protein